MSYKDKKKEEDKYMVECPTYKLSDTTKHKEIWVELYIMVQLV